MRCIKMAGLLLSVFLGWLSLADATGVTTPPANIPGAAVGYAYPAITTVITLDKYGTTDLCATTTGIIDQIGLTAVKLLIDRPVTCTQSKSTPTTLQIEMLPGGIITVSTTKILTFNAPFIAPIRQQVFTLSGTGLVKFGSGVIDTLYAAWWGVVADGSTDDTVAWKAVLIAAGDLYNPGTGGGFAARVRMPSGVSIISSALPISSAVLLEGQSQGGSQFQGTGDFNFIEILGGSYAGGYVFHVTLQDFSMVKVGGTTASNYIKIDHAFEINLLNIETEHTTGNGITIVNCNTVKLYNIALGGFTANVGYGLYVTNSSVFTYGGSLETFKYGFNVNKSGSVMSALKMYGMYFEGITNTLGIFDATWGSELHGPHILNGTGSASVVGFSFINGAHHNLVEGGNIGSIYDDGFSPTFKTDATSFMNRVLGTSYQTSAGTLPDAGIIIDDSLPAVVANYTASISPDVTIGKWYLLTVDSGSAFTIHAPANASAYGTIFKVTLKNTSGGAMGTVTMDAAFHSISSVDSRKPANGKNRTFTFIFDGTNWLEDTNSADVSN